MKKKNVLLELLEFDLAILCGYVIACFVCIELLGYSGEFHKISWFIGIPCSIGTALISYKLDHS